MIQLVRLQTPRGWSICDNKFYDIDPVIEENSNFIKNWNEGFIEDVMWIREHGLNTDGQLTFHDFDYFSIDLSWLPDSSINGSYYAKLFWITNEEMKEIESFENVNRFEIRDKIEFWMNDITENYMDYREKMKILT